MEAPDVSAYQLTERRIALLTLVIGAAAAAGAAWFSTIRMGAGILSGAMLAWVSFRWLESALDGLMRTSTAAPGAAPSAVGGVLKIMGRYALIAGAVYGIFFLFQVPIVSMLLGLCALGAATIVATLYEIWHPAD